jgi:GT2 family glycosyltransferase
MLRMNFHRDPYVDRAEIILVCQTTCVFSLPARCLRIDAKLTSYNRPKLLNLGARAAGGDVLCLLDSDRVLPKNYLSENVPRVAGDAVIAPERMFKLSRPHTDDALQAATLRGHSETRRVGEPHGVCTFSGNTLIRRSDYLGHAIGDEDFQGYGYNDNDMEFACLRAGLTPRLVDAEELHLYHPPSISVDGLRFGATERLLSLIHNGIRFHTKWKLKHSPALKAMIAEYYLCRASIPPDRWQSLDAQLTELGYAPIASGSEIG